MKDGTQLTWNGKRVTITGSYDGYDGPDDPPGYYYKVEGEDTEHWVSAYGASVRFEPLWPRNDREWANVNQPLTTD